MDLQHLMQSSHANAREKGFWDEPKNFGEAIALIHSEASEALEEYRLRGFYNMLYTSESGKVKGIASEMADIIIRVCDVCQGLGIPLVEAIEKKAAYNRTRPHKHGKII